MKEYPFDERRTLIVPGNREKTLEFCIQEWLNLAQEAIDSHGFFAVALSGGSTPKAIYKGIVTSEKAKSIPWNKVFLFWSDERNAPPDDPDSNFHMSMVEGGLKNLPIPQENIFRMHAEKDLEKNALDYEKKIREVLKGRPFDLIMLGVGEDGHTASLFPHTQALREGKHLVVANHIPQKNTWRMTFTFDLINKASHIHLYLIGNTKAQIIEHLFTSPYDPETFPSQRVGTFENKALWITDEEASKNILSHLK